MNPHIKVVKGDVTDDFLFAAHQEKIIAVDIETDGLDYNGNIGAVSLYAPNSNRVKIVHSLDVVPENLLYILSAPSITKVFHNAMFDMRFLYKSYNAEFSNVACTRIALKILDPQKAYSHKLGDAIERFLGVHIEKDQALSNWFQEELTPDQIRYAAN